MAFLPQFINPNEPALLQSLMVAAIHFSVAMVYQCVLAAMVDKARIWLQGTTVNRVFDTFTGSVLLFIGFKIVTEK